MSTSAEKQILESVDADRLMETTRTLAKWKRLSGSDEERQAFEYLRNHLDNLGYRTELHHPVCLVSLPVEASLLIVESGETIDCITHSFSASTGSDGIEAELVYAGAGDHSAYEEIEARGAAVLVEGLATPNKVAPAEHAGAVAVIHNSGPHLHEMTISPVWGSPTSDTFHLLPRLPHISVNEKGADRLRELMTAGNVQIRITTEVDTGWRPLPMLIADLHDLEERPIHVLLSGHVDCWHYGAMDNGSANATMLECARILATCQDQFTRSLRLCFWSGHSHARYATSTWYADEYWRLLHNYCVAHVNVDSPGGIGATDLSSANTMAETYPIARRVFADVAGGDLRFERIGRLGDQSFWGAGVPSFYCSISQQPPDAPATGIGALTGKGGGLGWWWHTPDDTLDKIDPENLVRDTRIVLSTLYRLCTISQLPFDQSRPALEILDELKELAAFQTFELNLEPLVEESQRLIEAAEHLGNLDLPPDASQDELSLYNGCVAGVSRILMPVNYTTAGAFEHDAALIASKPLPGLQRARTLAEIRENPDLYYPALNKLRRERNRVLQALTESRALVEQTLAVFAMDD